MRGKGTTRFSVLFGLIIAVAMLAANVAPILAAPPAVAGERGDVLIGFTRTPGPAEQALVRALGGRVKYSYRLVPAIAANIPEAAIAALERNPNVTVVEPDIGVYAVDVNYDAELANTWGVERIGAGTVHVGGSLGTGVKVAIIDSGIDCSHPELNANCAGGYDFVNQDDDPADDNGHGTHVAGTVAALRNGSGVVGVAPEAALYALKVLDAAGSGSYSDVIAALEWAVGKGVQVTNLSLGSDRDPGSLVKEAFDNAYAAGLLNVCAAGNSGNPAGRGNNVIYPARYASCIAVAATDANDTRASWSSTGDQVELAAPGVAVYSTWPMGMSSTYDPQPECDETGCYKYASGTSMASPHVAGAAALVWAAYPTWTNAEVRARLQTTADDLGAAGRDPQYGYGLVNAAKAAPEPVDIHDVAIIAIDAPSSVVVGDEVSVHVTVKNQGTYEETFDVVLTDDTANVTIGTQPVTLPAGASDTVSFAWDTTGATPGDHTLTARHDLTDDNAGNDSMSITVAVTEPGEPGATMHVGGLDARKDLKGKSGRWEVFATVTIHDEGCKGVSNATVTGAWSGDAIGTVSGITASDGTVTFSTGNMSGGTTVTFTITDVTHETLVYAPASNDVSTTITITR